MMPLQIAPEFLDVVEFGSVFRQPLDREPGGPLSEGSARCLAGVDRAVVEDEHDRFLRTAGHRAILRIDLLQKRDEIGTALAPAGAHHQVARRPVEYPEHRHLGGLAGRWNAQIRALLGPGMGQIGMGQRLRLIAEQEHDIARLGLRLQELAAQASAVHGVSVLAALQGMARPAPAEIPFWRSTTESREREMRTPERFSISSARRGSVQFGRSATGPERTSSATASARSALTGFGPGATDVFSASTPPLMKALRQNRTVSSRTPKASAICPLVQPERVSKIARARSASPRSRERLSAIRARLCSSVAATGDLPAMIPISGPIKHRDHGPHALASPS